MTVPHPFPSMKPLGPEDEMACTDDKISREIAQQDRQTLHEGERERLLTDGRGDGGFRRISSEGDGAHNKVKLGRHKTRRFKREARRSHKQDWSREESELMYEMEEGGRRSDSESVSSRNSSDSDQQRLETAIVDKHKRRTRFMKRAAIYFSVVILLILLLFAAYRASRASNTKIPKLLSNGTSDFAPTTILISLDGFRADFLNRGLTPTLNSLIHNGVSPQYMLPSFPSLTFPNHYTLVTGLYPESHGIVGNTFWDPDLKEEFSYTDPLAMQPKWWGGEPLWVTAERQGTRTAIHMWPGSEAHIGDVEPAYVDKFNGSEKLSLKVDRMLQLLDLPGPESSAALADQSRPRPQLIAAYVPVVDADGHKYGPNSTEIRQTIHDVDDMLHSLLVGLQERNLSNIVNVVVVSDHGMASTSVERLIQLEDLLSTDLIEHIDGWPLYGLRPNDLDDLERMYNQLRRTPDPNFDVYLRDKDMPERYHFSKNSRIAPLWIIPQAGWAVVEKDKFDIEEALRNGEVYHPRGLHGYDFEHPLMRAIFIATGPAFPHTPGSRVDVFQNIEVYNIVCDSIGVTPKANNGTLRLPLKPIGLHPGNGTPIVENPSDPP